MKNDFQNIIKILLATGSFLFPGLLFAQKKMQPSSSALHNQHMLLLAVSFTLCLLIAALFLLYRTKQLNNLYNKKTEAKGEANFNTHLNNLDSSQIEEIIAIKNNEVKNPKSTSKATIPSKKILVLAVLLLITRVVFAQLPASKP